MTHDYKRNGTTTLFAAIDVLGYDSLSWPQWDGLKWLLLCGRGRAVVTG